MSKKDIKAKEFIENEYRKFWETQAAAYLGDRQFSNGNIFENLYLSDEIGIPALVLNARDFYNKNCDDWGGAAIYKAQIGEEEIYIVRVTTDGDDGWVEVFDVEGQHLASGRTYIELISWGPVEEIRNYVNSLEPFPAELSDRQTRTMWAKR